MEKFYKDLYSKKSTDPIISKSFLRYQKGRLTPRQREEIDGPIRIQELRRAAMQQKQNKTPGEDGIGVEFYIQFLDVIEVELVKTLDEMYYFQKTGGNLARGIIKTIFKKGDPTDIRNYRPITLLDIDYKILSKILANRLKEVLHQYVNPLNKISDLNLVLREIAQDMKSKGKGAMISIDFQKAYDSVDHEFLQATLKEAGFGKKFRNFFKAIYEQ